MDIINHTSRLSKYNRKTTIEIEDSFTSDISKFRFQFYEEVEFAKEYHSFPDMDI